MIDISLIKNWHLKAKEDYFSRYIFEYLAFEAFLKKYKYSEEEIESTSGNTKERSYIQKIKNEHGYLEKWVLLVLKNEELGKIVRELILFLENEPLAPDVNWWSCLSFNYNECSDNGSKGKILNENDFVNIVEFWYEVRNNLFHAGKNPNNQRDEKLVIYAYTTLAIFFENVLLPEMEEKTIYPAIWEEFEYKFFKGEAEVIIKAGNSNACANVYELLFAEDKYFPIILNGKQINKAYIIDKLSFNLTNLYGDPYLLAEEWEKITRRANNVDKKTELTIYFKKILPLLRDIIDLGI